MAWTYAAKEGLVWTGSDVQLLFGASRESIRILLKYDSARNKGRFPEEDRYEDVLGASRIRLGFKDDKLGEIEVLKGLVLVDGVEVPVGGPLKSTLKNLRANGHMFRKGTYSYTDFKGLFDLGDKKANGGERDEIAWFYASPDLSHLKS